MMIRAKFRKAKRLRYISHLQLLDTLRRAIRRAELPGKYSEGYNPTLNLSLSQPLPVGMAGGGEYLDLELTAALEPEDFCRRLNDSLPRGIEILQARLTDNRLKSLQAVVDRARYHLLPPLKDQSREVRDSRAEAVLQEFRNKKEIIVVRKRRNKSDRSYNLREMVHEIKTAAEGRWSFLVSTGSRGNVRPEEIIRGLQQIDSSIGEQPLINFYREGLYVSRPPKLLTPLADEIMEGE